jgi:endonuclease/exonuclease/phosphatase family metal-dependent hydrolase
MRIRLLQWNIWYKEPIVNVAEELEKINPDIACLQEVTRGSDFNPNTDNAKFLSDKLNYQYYYHEAQSWENDHVKTQGNAILTKFPIISTKYKYIQQPSENSESYANEGRVYIETELQIDNKNLTVGTTHMSYTHKFILNEAKKKEADNLLEIIKDKKEKYVFCGDLNARINSYILDNIKKYLKNGGPSLDTKTWTTKPFNYNDFVETELNWRLDHIFITKDINIHTSKVLKTEYSDHLPVLSELEV